VTGSQVITADDSRFQLKWSIQKDDVSCILCNNDCDVIIGVETRSSIEFDDLFGSCEYIGFIQACPGKVILLGSLHLNVIFFIIWLCVCVNTCIFCCQKHMVNNIQVHTCRRRNNAFHQQRVVDCFAFGRQLVSKGPSSVPDPKTFLYLKQLFSRCSKNKK